MGRKCHAVLISHKICCTSRQSTRPVFSLTAACPPTKTDELHIPNWFKELPFDDAEMEAAVVDKKIDNLLSVLQWDLAQETDTSNTFNSLFEFE
jgi:hypothetical protein